MTSLLCVSAGCPCPQDPLAGPRAGSSMLFPVLTAARKDRCEGSFVPWSHVSTHICSAPSDPSRHPALTRYPNFSPSPSHAAPQMAPGHILRLQAGPLFPEQRGVCAGSMCPRTTQGTQTCSQMQACSQSSLSFLLQVTLSPAQGTLLTVETQCLLVIEGPPSHGFVASV